MSIRPTEESATGHPVHPNPPAARADALVAAEKGKCDHCFIVIVWARTEAKHDGTRMPLDAAPATDEMGPREGNVLLYADDKWGLIASVVGARGRRKALREAGWHLYLHHRVSCPYASRWAGKTAAPKTPKTYSRRSRA